MTAKKDTRRLARDSDRKIADELSRCYFDGKRYPRDGGVLHVNGDYLALMLRVLADYGTWDRVAKAETELRNDGIMTQFLIARGEGQPAEAAIEEIAEHVPVSAQTVRDVVYRRTKKKSPR